MNCYFISRAVFKNLLKIGLGRHYNRYREFKVWSKRVMAIPLLPAELIPEVFENLLSQNIPFASVEDRAKFRKFQRYLRQQWIDLTPPDVFSVFGCINATNNGCESYHAELKRRIKVHNPNVWNFILHLNNILEDRANEYQRMLNFGPDGFTRNQSKALQVRHVNLYFCLENIQWCA